MFSRSHTILLIGLVILDQLTKLLASLQLTTLLVDTKIPFVSLVLVHNTGAAYGLFQNQRFFLIAIAILVILACVLFRQTLAPTRTSKMGLIFLLAGAIGNLTDRLIHGYVIDFIHTPFFPVFNFADVFIDIGIGLMILDMFLPSTKPDTPS